MASGLHFSFSRRFAILDAMLRFLALVALSSNLACASLVSDVRADLAKEDFPAAEKRIAAHRSLNGPTPESIVAHSWLGRGALALKRFDQANEYAAATRAQCLTALKSRKLDDEAQLPLALGASIEVQGNVLAAKGQRSEAVSFLKDELKHWYATSIRTRIQKNIHLLSLVGTNPPPLTLKDHYGPTPPSFQQLQGKAVLLFFWAHWCVDCKYQGPIIAQLRDKYAPKGLAVVAPTQYYGYAANGDDATPAKERPYIERVRQTHYTGLLDISAPISEEDFKVYGVSTTPTLVLLDRTGKVSMYHPGKMTYEELANEIDKALK